MDSLNHAHPRLSTENFLVTWVQDSGLRRIPTHFQVLR
jgi:hypothetical protein